MPSSTSPAGIPAFVATAATDPHRICVTRGTSNLSHLLSLIDRALAILPERCDVVWQTLRAGGGAFVRSFEAGKVRILVPRRVSRGEHVEDRQEQPAQVGKHRRLASKRTDGHA